jgi:hypothetical protein
LKSSIDAGRLGLSGEAADIWQKKTEAEFKLWAERKNACDAIGVNDYYTILLRLVLYPIFIFISNHGAGDAHAGSGCGAAVSGISRINYFLDFNYFDFSLPNHTILLKWVIKFVLYLLDYTQL